MHLRTTLTTALIAALVLLGTSASAGADPATVADRQASPGPDLAFRGDPVPRRLERGGAISRGKLRRKLRQLARRAPASSGFYVTKLGGKAKKPLFDRNGGHSRKLASNEKLFTTTTALHRLGPKWRIATRVKVRGNINGKGKLKGDLYLIGGGDPSFGSGGISELARQVRKAGIRRISGKVIGDDSVFDRRRGVPDSNWGPSPYIAPLSGLVYGGSTYSGDPAKQAAKAFRDGLRDAGVKIGGKVKVGRLPGSLRGRTEVAEYESPTIAALVRATNKDSVNFYAEMLCKRLGRRRSGRGRRTAAPRRSSATRSRSARRSAPATAPG